MIIIPTVTARSALAQNLFWDREKTTLATASIATLLCQQTREQEINARRLHRCLEQIAILERWQTLPQEPKS